MLSCATVVACSSSDQAGSPAPGEGTVTPAATPYSPQPGPSARSSSANRQNVRPVPDRTVPAPSGGNVHQTVAPVHERTLSARPLTHRAHLGPRVSGSITQVRSINAKTHIPGEIGGPSVEVTVDIRNHSSHSISVGTVAVNAFDDTGAPAVAVTTSPARSFAGNLRPGRSATGVYVFSVGAAQRDPITITVDYVAGHVMARFVGKVK